MTVGQLIEQLSRVDPEALVVRADTDWSGVDIKEIEVDIFLTSYGDGVYREEFYPEFHDEQEEGPLLNAIRIR